MSSDRARTKVTCADCGKIFSLPNSEVTARRRINRNGLMYCSLACSARSQRNLGHKLGVTPMQREQSTTVHVKFHGLMIGE
jgi:hypothetical protein